MEEKENLAGLAAEETAGASEEAPVDLAAEVEALKAERDQYHAIAAQAQADGINYRKWAEKEMQRLRQQGSERAVLSMLPVLDNLERALESGSSDDGHPIVAGVRMVRDQFVNALSSLGVKVEDPLGEKFSPVLHDAVAMSGVTDPEQDGLIQNVYQKGYSLAGKVIRPAKVTVGRYTVPAEQ